jgi:Leucine-rich repeat (LRR) protein
LKALGKLKNLTMLDLRSTALTDAGLTEIREYQNLTTLDLTSTRITDAG